MMKIHIKIKNLKDKVYENCDIFENNTHGAFIFCDNIDYLKTIIDELKEKLKENRNFKFNFITTDNSWEN